MDHKSRRMLFVLAHPDDESFGSAGTIARYVAEGVEVSLICTTNGDVGSADPEFMKGYSSVSEMRLAELECAAEVLGLKNVYPFGFRDSGMAGSPENKHRNALAAADLDVVVEKVTRITRELRPQVVITFDPYGGYGHPDHIVTHNATVEAFHAAADPARYPAQLTEGVRPFRAQKLYFTTFDRRWLKLWLSFAPLLFIDPRRMGRNKDINAWEIARHSYPIHTSIATGPYQLVAQQARACHASQLGGVGPRRMSESLSRLIFGIREDFMRAYPPVNGKGREHDLFEGVAAD